MSANGIAQLPNKRQRQEQKLAVAATKRAHEGKHCSQLVSVVLVRHLHGGIQIELCVSSSGMGPIGCTR